MTKEWDDIKIELERMESLKQPYFPPRHRIFQALQLTPFKRVKAVILGQDPYHNGHATGLAFSSNHPILPDSLANIFKEYQSDLGFEFPLCGNLCPWAEEGVLMLNTALTVLPGQPSSHDTLGWDKLVSEVLFEVTRAHPAAVFLLWGKHAQAVALPIIGAAPKVVSAHPSPFSAHKGFFGSKPFTATNALRVNARAETINWRLP